MKLTDAQLGRIARAAVHLSESTVGIIARSAARGDLGATIEWCSTWIGRESALLTVLREVAAEAELTRAICIARFFDEDEQLVEADWHGYEILTRTANYREWFASAWVTRITITNEHHGACWTWTRESER